MATERSEYTLEEFVITSERFPGTEISLNPSLVQELSIFENLEYPYLTANALIVDQMGIKSAFGIYGNERVRVVIGGPINSEIPPVTKNFVITKLIKSEQVNDKEEVHAITMVEEFAYLNYLQKVSKTYHGKGDKIISRMLQNFLRKDMISLYESEILQPEFQYLIPYLNPLDAIEIIRDRISTPDGAPFFLYSTLRSDNIILNDLQTMLAKTPWNATKKKLEYVYSTMSSNIDDPDRPRDLLNILKWQNVGTESILDLAMAGAFGADLHTLDLTSSGTYKTNNNTIDVVQRLFDPSQKNQSLTIDNSMVIGEPAKDVASYKTNFFRSIVASRVFDQRNGLHDHVNDGKMYRTKIQSRSIRSILLKSVVNIEVPGIPYLQEERGVGNSIRVIVPVSSTSDNSASGVDTKLSGDYLIYQMRHIFSAGEAADKYRASMNIVKMTNPERTN